MFKLFGGKGKKAQTQDLIEPTDTQGPFKGGFQPKAVPMDLNFPTELPHGFNQTANPSANPLAPSDFGASGLSTPELLDFDPHAAAPPTNAMQPDYLPADDSNFSLNNLPVSDFTDAPLDVPPLDEDLNKRVMSDHASSSAANDNLFLDSFDLPNGWGGETGLAAEPVTNPFDALPTVDLANLQTISEPIEDLSPGSDDWARQAAARLDAVGDALYPPETFDVGVHTETVRPDSPAVGGFGGEVSWNDVNDLKASLPPLETQKFNWSEENAVTFTSNIKPESSASTQMSAVLSQTQAETLPGPNFQAPVLSDDFTLPQPTANQPDPTMGLFSPVLADDFTLPDSTSVSTINQPDLEKPPEKAFQNLFDEPFALDANQTLPEMTLETAPTFSIDPLSQAELFNLPSDEAQKSISPFEPPIEELQPLSVDAQSPVGLAGLQQQAFQTEPAFDNTVVPEAFTARDVRDTVLLGEHCVHLVQQGQAFYLVSQAGEQWHVIKDLSPLGLKPSTGINVMLEGYAGGKEVYTVNIGPWKAILNADTQGVVLHTEVNA